jgi:RNA polymerase sigma-70 factor (ECF subfamily)
VRAFLDGLSQDEREAFVLCELEAVTGTDAALALGVNRNTLYSRLRKLRAQFEGAVAQRFGGGA